MRDFIVRLDDDTWLQLWAMARRNGITLEEAARRCIVNWLRNFESLEPGPDHPLNDPTVRKLLTDLRPVIEAMERDD